MRQALGSSDCPLEWGKWTLEREVDTERAPTFSPLRETFRFCKELGVWNLLLEKELVTGVSVTPPDCLEGTLNLYCPPFQEEP